MARWCQFLLVVGLVSLALGSERILSGVVVDPLRNRYVVSVQYGESLVCTGVVVGKQLVLTAAHCLEHSMSNYFRVCSMGTCVGIRQAMTPASYARTKLTAGRDLGLLLLDIPLAGVNPIPVVLNGDIEAGTNAEALGFGVHEHGSSPDKNLRAVDMLVRANEKCKSLLYSSSTKEPNLLCGDGNHDYSQGGACEGDSGGPLIVRTVGGRAAVIGIASYVWLYNGRCNPSFETVFMRLSSADHREFLTEAAKWYKAYLYNIDASLLAAPKPSGSPFAPPPNPSPATKPRRNYYSIIGVMEFPPIPVDATVCKTVDAAGIKGSSDVVITQEHLATGSHSFAWVDLVLDKSLRICIRGRHGLNSRRGKIRVWYASLSSIAMGNPFATVVRATVPVGQSCREVHVPPLFGIYAGLFPTVAYNVRMETSMGLQIESDPATALATIREHKRRIFLNLKGVRPSCQPVSLPRKYERKPMVLIGVNKELQDQGVTTWLRWSEDRNLTVCASIATREPQNSRAGVRLAFLNRDDP